MTKAISKTKARGLVDLVEGVQDNYTNDVKVLARFLRDVRMDFDLAGLRAYYLDQKEQYRAGHIRGATFNKRIAAVKSRVRMMIDRGDLKGSELFEIEHELKTFKAVKLNGLSVNPQDLPTTKEVEKLIAESKDGLVRHIVRFLAGTGLRISEALGIRLTDIEKAKDHFNITVRGKGMVERTIMFSLEGVKRIRTAYMGDTFLFEHGGKQYRRVPTNDRIRMQSKLILGRDFHAHTFRHYFATDALKRGWTLKAVSLYLGHASTQITADIYDQNRLGWEDLKKLEIFTKAP